MRRPDGLCFDLLSGGGQYSYLDWRLWPDKFPYASGVSADEPVFVRAYNLAQYYFGLYESIFTGSLTMTTPGAYATLYDNRVWNEKLLAVANMTNRDAVFQVAAPETIQALGLDTDTLVFDITEKSILLSPEGRQDFSSQGLKMRPYQTRLLLIRKTPEERPCHLWGGKRIAETWEPATGTLSVLLDGPEGIEEEVVFATGGIPLKQVSVDGAPVPFAYDKRQGVAHGKIVFKMDPLRLEAFSAEDGDMAIPEGALQPGELAKYYEAH